MPADAGRSGNTARGLTAALAACVFWGVNVAASKIAVGGFPPFAAAFLRFSMAAAVLSPAVMRARPLSRGEWRLYLPLAAVGIAGFSVTYFLGLKRTTAADASVVIGANPLATMLIELVWLRTALRGRRAAGIVLSMGGIAATTIGAATAGGDELQRIGGDLLLIVAVVAWSAYTVGNRLATRDRSPVEVAARMTMLGALILAAPAAASGQLASVRTASLGDWAALVYTGTVAAAVAYALWAAAVRDIGPTGAALSLNLVPVLGLISSAVMLGERLPLSTLAGAALVVSGILLAEWPARRRPQPAPIEAMESAEAAGGTPR